MNARGELSRAGYFDRPDLQKLLFQEENVDVVWTGSGWRVDLKKYGWKNTMAEAEELEKRYVRDDI